MTVGSESVLVFTVKVCQDAIVTLQEYPGINHYNSYEVIIGLNNDMTEVLNTPGGARLAYANTKDILSCNSYRQFWISWEDKLLEIGSGPSPGVSRFLQWDMSSTFYSIRAAAFSTGGTHKGTWEFKNTNGTINVYLFFDQFCELYRQKTLKSHNLLLLRPDRFNIFRHT